MLKLLDRPEILCLEVPIICNVLSQNTSFDYVIKVGFREFHLSNRNVLEREIHICLAILGNQYVVCVN